jgi:dolichyl-phosphate-mannose--protein O-mannosyl transferase
MVENVIFLLIYIALLVLVVYLIQWFLEKMGFSIDARVMQVIWVIVVLVVILLCWRAFAPFIAGHGVFPR